MSFVQLCRRYGGEQIRAQHVDLRWTFYTVRRISIRGDVECLVCVLRVVKVIRDGKMVRTGEIEIYSREERLVVDLV